MQPNHIFLPVADVPVAAAFWAGFLGSPPAEGTATFAFFPLANGWGLGLWQRADIAPPVTAPAGGVEIAVMVDTPDAVDAAHRRLVADGIHPMEPPTERDFGRTFVVADPDGHRVRIYCMTPRTDAGSGGGQPL